MTKLGKLVEGIRDGGTGERKRIRILTRGVGTLLGGGGGGTRKKPWRGEGQEEQKRKNSKDRGLSDRAMACYSIFSAKGKDFARENWKTEGP